MNNELGSFLFWASSMRPLELISEEFTGAVSDSVTGFAS